MTKFDLKKAPKGWTYPFSKREIRTFIGELDANFENVLFEGTRKPHNLSCWIGILQSEKVDGEWYFSLELSCLKEEYIVPWKDEITKMIFAKIKQWIKKKKDLLPTAPDKSTSLYLGYDIRNKKCVSTCFEVDNR
jgi:hypothetical protein